MRNEGGATPVPGASPETTHSKAGLDGSPISENMQDSNESCGNTEIQVSRGNIRILGIPRVTPDRMTRKEPIMKSFPRLDGVPGFQFWCPWCQKWHLHGIGEGPRVSHCTNRDSLLKSGYTIKKMSKAELMSLAKALFWYQAGVGP